MNDMFLLYLLTRLDSITIVCASVLGLYLLVDVTLLIAAPWEKKEPS